MDDGRHFSNPFPAFSKSVSSTVLDVSENKLSTECTDNLKKSVTRLLNILEENIARDIDWGDVSVYTGCSGYALLYVHLADVLDDKDHYLKKALPLAEKCAKKVKGRRHTFLCGDAGPLAIAAVVYAKLEMNSEITACVEGVKKIARDVVNPSSGLPDEILYGRAGYLYSLVFLQKQIGKEAIDDALIRSVISAILDSGRSLSKKEKLRVPLMYEWHEKKYLGAAHGIIGILFMLLQLKEHLTSQELNDLVRPTVDYVCSLQFPSGNFPSSLGNNSDRLVHWCHGAPGAIFLMAKAYQVFGEQSYLDHAKKSADCIWDRGLLHKGYGLCHGASGNAYGLLYLYQVTHKVEYLYRAAQFAFWCQDYGKHGCKRPDRPMSMFEGLAGTIHLLADLTKPDEAKFPAFVI